MPTPTPIAPPAEVVAAPAFPKVGELKSEYTVSQNALWEYYSTNSGIYAKNPSISGDSGGGAGPDPELAERVTKLESSQKVQDENIDEISGNQEGIRAAAENSVKTLTDDFILSSDLRYDEVNDIVSDQDVLYRAQKSFLDSIS